MQIIRTYSLTLTVIIGVLVSGCAHMAITGSADVDKNSFGAKKRFAVVSIASMKRFQGEQGIGQKFTSDDNIPGMNTQPIINKLDQKIIQALGSSKYFTLVPENKVLMSKAYKSLAEDEKVIKVLFISVPMNVANNYKYVSDEKKYVQLAKDLGVDGVIGITLNFTVSQGGGQFNLGPLSLGKKSYSAMATITAIAYNKDGKVIWKDSTMKEAEPGDSKAIVLIDTSNMTDTNFEKLHPSAIEIGGKAVDVLLARFDDTMVGKGTSSFQSVK
ncbi:hypothetical protein GALL_30550 [mine drainage metagenome]|uniref:Lipoprotein n=1 Tax=mine drainage metagenome TaxID=410659 RepID=A0A1J5TJ67_9ZZZZ